LHARGLTGDGEGLLALADGVGRPGVSAVRLVIGGDLELLFERGVYVGWMLRHLLRHLSSAPDVAPPADAEVGLGAVLRDYLALVVEPELERMSDGDPAPRAALLALRDRLGASGAAAALRHRIDQVLETFYG
jgi:hypothetical protein